jgi:hypothetical protein
MHGRSVIAICSLAGGLLAARALAQQAGANPATQPSTQPAAAAEAVESLGPVTRITLKLDNAKPADAFAELSKQAGFELRPSPKNLWEGREWATVTLDLKDVSFWQAVRELCDKVGVSIQRQGLERDMIILQGGGRIWGQAPAFEAGPFMIVARTLNRTHVVDLNAKAGDTRTCTVGMIIYSEPKLRVLRISSQPEIEVAVDENGRSLVAIQPPVVAKGVLAYANTWTWSVSALLHPPADAGQSISLLKGSVRALVQTRADTVEVDKIDTTRTVVKTASGHKLTVKDFRKTGTSYSLSLNVTRDPSTGSAWKEANLSNMFRLVDSEGHALTRRSYGSGGTLADSVDLQLSFAQEDWNGNAAAGEPAKLIWEVPAETKEVAVPFEFRDLPLP